MVCPATEQGVTRLAETVSSTVSQSADLRRMAYFVCTRCRSLFVRAWTTSAGLWELTASSQYGGHIGDRTTEALRMPPKHPSSMSSPLGGGAVASASLQNVVCFTELRPSVGPRNLRTRCPTSRRICAISVAKTLRD